MSFEWKRRGTEEQPYKARKVLHEANTSLEYGEKTWTTAQTVRDLMQNHLDAETERYFRGIATSVFDEATLKQYSEGEKNGNIETFLHAAFLFARHVEDMTPSARQKSEVRLRQLARGLPVNAGLKTGSDFSPAVFLEVVRPLSEERPAVSYDITDTTTGESAGLIPYDSLATEPLYQERVGSGFRYQIAGMKIADHGSGFDSQLSALYLSSKTGKKHLRGKFGEGAKMSELHALRGGAVLKMRSTYTTKNGDDIEKSRTWQARPLGRDGRLVSQGVEVERVGSEETGSMAHISLGRAKKAFREEFIQNTDPRIGGLARNVAEFRAEGFSYPMPISEEYLSGIDMKGDGEVQYVQGLRVELAKESFGYDKPWYSYDVLDSGILGGRDRNEIKGDIQKRIQAFWFSIDDEKLMEQLVSDAVHDEQRCAKVSAAPELKALEHILRYGVHERKAPLADSEREKGNRIIDVGAQQMFIDRALLAELGIEVGVHTLVISTSNARNHRFNDIVTHARYRGYEVKTTAADFSHSALTAWKERIGGGYEIVTMDDLRREMDREKEKVHAKNKEQQEGERERLIREVFTSAVKSVNTLAEAAGFGKTTFELEFYTPERVNQDRYDPWSYSEDDVVPDWNAPDPRLERYPAPITLREGRRAEWKVVIDPMRGYSPRDTGGYALQRQIEIHLLAAFQFVHYEFKTQEDVLKSSQEVLDTMITKLLPDASPILRSIPSKLAYEKDPAVMTRMLEALLQTEDEQQRRDAVRYHAYRNALSADLAVEDAQRMLYEAESNDDRTVEQILKSRVFVDDAGALTYYNEKGEAWETLYIDDIHPIATWQKLPVYELTDGRYFIPASMRDGAVLAKGEGKKREYVFSDGEDFVEIGTTGVGFQRFGYGWKHVIPHADGLIVEKRRAKDRGLAAPEYIRQELAEYVHYPSGMTKREGKIQEGMSSTAIPIEYGKDEWDNPVRVFQDIIQNHVDASEGGQGVELKYEVEQPKGRVWKNANQVRPWDRISGLMVHDTGSGYFPNDIATMGASSKKSPLFAGKYGEGQKMVAAAALRSGLELTYESTVEKDGALQSWSARTVPAARSIVLEGREIEKQLVAFDVALRDRQPATGSTTIVRLSDNVTPAQMRQWAEWVSIIDPRKKDPSRHGGLARYVRQLRAPGSERVHSVGSISVLLDEPGAVYENGLRINPQAEKGRALAFGYDVPEIVTTRERNSYDPQRLREYVKHALSHTTDTKVIEEVLRKVGEGQGKNPDLDIGVIMHESDNAAPVWAGVARKVWPGYVLHSHEKFGKLMYPYEDEWYTDADEIRRAHERAQEARSIEANILHLDRNKILDVSEGSYEGFSKLLPTAESMIKRMALQIVPAPPAVKKVLSAVIAESTKTFMDMVSTARTKLTREQFTLYPVPAARLYDRATVWADAKAIADADKVALAPVESAFHGKAEDRGVIFNEALLFSAQRRNLAETSLHEVAHVISGYSDYTEDFVRLLHELALHFAAQKAGAKK